ncbi:MAG TPA: Hsp70 family protein, partial [Blastocatellia bacterium]|nr:Hsp70 family protein [Blastocatellia bacterium]
QRIPLLVKFVEPLDYQEHIGIDFGTTASCVAILDKNNQPFVIPLDRVEPGSSSDPRIMPSVLYFSDDGTVMAGREAMSEAMIQPANAVTSIKRALGVKHTRVFGSREFSATDLAAEIISELVKRTEDSLFSSGQYLSPRRAVATVPVEFLDNQRRALLDACRLAGLKMGSNTPRGVIIDEAHAAVFYYLIKREPSEGDNRPERVLVFDFGGGTLDCAIVEIKNDDGKLYLKTLAPGGDSQLGGEDIDWVLVGLLADRVKQQYPHFDLDCLSDEQKLNHKFRVPEVLRAAYITRAQFKRQAEQAKIALGDATAIELSISPLLSTTPNLLQPFLTDGMGLAVSKITLQRQELEVVLNPFLSRAVKAVETACHRAGLGMDSIDTVLHVGRTSLLPLVRDCINNLLPNAKDRKDLIEPKLCVAMGAAFWGYVKDQPDAHIEFVGDANQTIHDIGYLAVETSRGINYVFVPVFPARTRFPCETTVQIPNVKDSLVLRLAENRGKNRYVKDNPEVAQIGIVRIDARGIPLPFIDVRFAIDENRVLEISANGQTQHIIEIGNE